MGSVYRKWGARRWRDANSPLIAASASQRSVPMVTATKSNHRMAKKDAVHASKSSSRAESSAESSVSAKGMLDSHPALKTTLAQIEKQYGEGSIMPLGTERAWPDRGHSHRQPGAGYRPGRTTAFPRAGSSKSSGPNRAARRRWPCTSSPGPRPPAASPLSSTPSMPWTPVGPRSWASSWKPCWSASPAAAKRRCRSPKC